VKDDHVVDRLERRDKLGALGVRDEWPAGLADRGVGVDADHEYVALQARQPQVPQMANVQQVENTVGQHDAPTAFVDRNELGLKRTQVENRTGHKPS
jgi:hypothetical protein